MTHARTTTLIALLFGATALSTASAGPARDEYRGAADLCYLQTLEAQRGTDPERLSVAPCNRAIHFQDLSREDKSIVYHNRGVIELARGEEDAARQSFERAVRLSVTVDRRNLALAQLAHRQGDYLVAVAQYDALIEASDGRGSRAIDRRTLVHNREQAARSLRAVELARPDSGSDPRLSQHGDAEQ